MVLTVAALLLLVGTAVSASESISLEEAISSAITNNPSLRSFAFDAEAAKARAPQAASLPDPMFMVGAVGVPINSFDTGKGDTIEYMVDQQIPFPSKLYFGHKAEKHEFRAKESKKAGISNEIQRSTTRAYTDLWRIEAEIEINRRTLKIYQSEKNAAETGYSSAGRPVSDPVRATVDMGEIEGRLAVLEQERLSAVSKLSALIGRSLDPYIMTRGCDIPSFSGDISALVSDAKESRPEIAEAESMIASRQARLSLSKSQYAPDFELRWGYMDMSDMQQNSWLGRVTVSVPLWFFSKQRYGVMESKALLNRARAEKEGAVLDTESDVRSAFAAFEAARKTVSIYQGTVVPRSRLLVRSSKEAYQSGKGSFLDIVDGVRRQNEAEIMLVRARADMVNFFADLEKAVGRDL